MKKILLLLFISLALLTQLWAEKKKVLLISGKDSHGNGAHEWSLGVDLLAKCLNEESNLSIEAVVSKLWPKDETIFNEVSSIIILSDGGGRHPARPHMNTLKKAMDRGVGLVCVHYAVEMPKGPDGDLFKSWLGGYFETHWSVNPHWTANFKNFSQHPISNGLQPFELKDEWYYHMRFADNGRVTPILSDLPPETTLKRKDGPHSNNPHVRDAVLKRKESQHVAWAYERPDGKGRSFGTTGAHYHTAWDQDSFRTMVLNAIAWTAHVEVPKNGVPSTPNPTKLQKLSMKLNKDPNACCEGHAVYSSPIITKKSKQQLVHIEASIKDAEDLYLVVDDADNGMSSDWANWLEPKLIDAQGHQHDLTNIKWHHASAGSGKVQLNKNHRGGPLKVQGKVYETGIGTHAKSIIHYKLPKDKHYVKFISKAGVDDEKKKYVSGLRFKVMTQKPKTKIDTFDKFDHVPTHLFNLPEDLEIKVWAKSPLFSNPTNMDIDYKGRIWVAEGKNYRRQKLDPKGDKIVVVVDKDGDGVADHSHVFVQETALVSPLGVAVIDNKVLVSQPPELIVYTDINRNAIFEPEIDQREILLSGFSGKNHDHSLHSVTVGPNGQYYFNHGNCGSKVTDREGWTLNAGSFYMTKEPAGLPSSDHNVYIGGVALRMNQDGTGLRPIGHNFRNSYEQVITSFGDVFQNDNDDPPNCRTTWLMEYSNLGFASKNGMRNWRSDMISGQTPQQAHWRQEDPGSLPAGDVYGGGSPTGIAFYENGIMEDRFKGYVLSCEPARNVVFGYRPKFEGAGITLPQRDHFLTSNPEKEFDGADFKRGNQKADELKTLFRPSDVTIGPDGAIYVADWFDSRVGGHGTRDKNATGAIYRIAPKNAKLSIPKFDLNTVEGQLAAFKSPSPNVRELGRSRLAKAGTPAIPEVSKLLEHKNEYIRARTVWLLSQMGSEGLTKVESLIQHSDPQMRIVAFRALRHTNHNMLEHAAELAKDPESIVRREVAVAMYNTSFEQSKDILLELAKRHDGKDRYYVEAFGLAAKQKELKTYLAIQQENLPEHIYRHLVWRLQPVLAIDEISSWAKDVKLSESERRSMLFSLSLIEDPKAAQAMKEISEQSGPFQQLASEFCQKRSQGIWFKYQNSEIAITYTDMLPPEQLGPVSHLPSTNEILKLHGNPEKGKVLFNKCSMCHKNQGIGIEFGPSLEGWGKSQTLEVIAKALLNPSEELAHGFTATELVVKGNKIIQGYIQAEGDPVIIKVFGGQDLVIPAKDIIRKKKLKKSLMISADKMGLSAQETRDLIEYLKKS
jgi:putative membrane-bound dehydrogenase-like protein